MKFTPIQAGLGLGTALAAVQGVAALLPAPYQQIAQAILPAVALISGLLAPQVKATFSRSHERKTPPTP